MEEGLGGHGDSSRTGFIAPDALSLRSAEQGALAGSLRLPPEGSQQGWEVSDTDELQ